MIGPEKNHRITNEHLIFSPKAPFLPNRLTPSSQFPAKGEIQQTCSIWWQFGLLLIYIQQESQTNPPSMRKVFAVLMVVLLLLSLLAECRKRGQSPRDSRKTRKKEKKIEAEYVPHYLTPSEPQFWFNCFLAAFLALAGGFCSGMTVGLNSLSMLNLEIMKQSPSEQSQKMAERILGVIHDHHLFLVTLLVGNAIVLESLPLVIHLIMPDWAAIIFSTFVVLVVAEVVPMSYSTGGHKYTIAYYGSPLVKWMIFFFWPLCYPIARGLDRLLGSQHQQRIYRRDFLTFINNRHKNELDRLQIEFINNVMNHRSRSIRQVMTPFEKCFMIQINEQITEKLIKEISQKQFSFILVYRDQPQNFVGYVKSKEVIIKYLGIGTKPISLTIQKLIKHKISDHNVKVYHDAIAIETLQIFELFKTRVLLVTDQQKHVKNHNDEGSSLSVVSVYDAKEWVVSEKSKIIGVVTLNQILYQVAQYRTEDLSKSLRKLSGHSDM